MVDIIPNTSSFTDYENAQQSPEITQSEAFWNSLKHGLSFNLDDEIAGITAAGRDDENALKAFGKGLIGYWLSGDKKYEDKYDKAVNKLRDYQRRVSNAHYWTSLGGNALGSALPSLATLGTGAVAGLVGRVAPHVASKLGQAFLKAGQTPVGRAGRYVGEKASPFLGITKNTTLPHLLKVGAASGAAHGAGEGEGGGGGLGAAGTAVGSLVGSALGSTVGGIRRLLSPSHKQGVSKDVLREISKHLSNDASEELGKSFGRSKSPTDYVVDHSPILQDLVFELSRKNPDASLDFIERAAARALGGGERIHQAADEHFVPRQNVTGLKDDLIASKKAATGLLKIEALAPIIGSCSGFGGLLAGIMVLAAVTGIVFVAKRFREQRL